MMKTAEMKLGLIEKFDLKVTNVVTIFSAFISNLIGFLLLLSSSENINKA